MSNHLKFVFTWTRRWLRFPGDVPARWSVTDVVFAHIARGKVPWKARVFSSSGISPATSEMEDKNNQGDDEQDMNEPTGDMKSESAGPKKQEQNGDNE